MACQAVITYNVNNWKGFTLDHAIELVVTALLTFCSIVMAVVGVVDGFLARIMDSLGIAPHIQILILMVVALGLVVAALRAFGGFVALLIIILLILLLLHRLLPNLEFQQLDPMPGMPSSQTQS